MTILARLRAKGTSLSSDRRKTLGPQERDEIEPLLEKIETALR
jgi:hypothetical protein